MAAPTARILLGFGSSIVRPSRQLVQAVDVVEERADVFLAGRRLKLTERGLDLPARLPRDEPPEFIEGGTRGRTGNAFELTQKAGTTLLRRLQLARAFADWSACCTLPKARVTSMPRRRSSSSTCASVKPSSSS